MSDLQQVVERAAGDPIPANCEVVEVHVAELKQLFNAIDPSPFREKDLDPDAEEFIVSWARDVSRDAQLALLVYLDRRRGLLGEYIVRTAGWRDSARKSFDWRLGRHVAAAGDLSLRLVADPR